MNEQNYQSVVDYIPKWRQYGTNRKFTVSTIMDITDVEAVRNRKLSIGFLEAYEIFKRLQVEDKIPGGIEL